MWRLVCAGHLAIGDLDRVSIDDVDAANAALDAWTAAEIRSAKARTNGSKRS